MTSAYRRFGEKTTRPAFSRVPADTMPGVLAEAVLVTAAGWIVAAWARPVADGTASALVAAPAAMTSAATRDTVFCTELKLGTSP
jgi:hypothetical protein